MSNENIMVIDGTRTGEENLTPILGILTDVLKEDDTEVQVFSPREMKLAHCIGCFGCWVETPGICRYKEPGVQEVLKSWIESDTIVLFTPVTFGGYSSYLKQILERTLPVLLPYFGTYHGEIHHLPRYSRRQRLICVGVQDFPNNTEADTFKMLVGRHAIDMHATSYAAEVISVNESDEHLREVFQSLLTRRDSFPWAKSIKPLMPLGEVLTDRHVSEGPPRACLIVGSPKTLSPSTSGVLGNYLLDRIKEHGWETESLTLKANLCTGPGEAALVSAVDRADLLIFAFPLYIDALPFLMTRALELIADHRRKSNQPHSQCFFAIANNGFPEAYQNNLALSICRNFATSSGIIWVGGLAMGAGEAICSGQPLNAGSPHGLPVFHVIEALNTTADALAKRQAVPIEAIKGIARNPIPHMPFWLWRLLVKFQGSKGWEKGAREYGVSKESMLARPYTPAI